MDAVRLRQLSSTPSAPTAELLRVEEAMLTAVDFRIAYPSPLRLLCELAPDFGLSELHFHVGWYLLELTLLLPAHFASLSSLATLLVVLRYLLLHLRRDHFDDSWLAVAGVTPREADRLARRVVGLAASLRRRRLSLSQQAGQLTDKQHHHQQKQGKSGETSLSRQKQRHTHRSHGDEEDDDDEDWRVDVKFGEKEYGEVSRLDLPVPVAGGESDDDNEFNQLSPQNINDDKK